MSCVENQTWIFKDKHIFVNKLCVCSFQSSNIDHTLQRGDFCDMENSICTAWVHFRFPKSIVPPSKYHPQRWYWTYYDYDYARDTHLVCTFSFLSRSVRRVTKTKDACFAWVCGFPRCGTRVVDVKCKWKTLHWRSCVEGSSIEREHFPIDDDFKKKNNFRVVISTR